ncbi:branched-chain amino acid ABC transporter substrate-binding protein [Nocardioides nematodiphilus]|uniref:branched-chain amino acid ABC transporter substrate-binding protein n=1 Tax=Nocardioides nematodiphilus TaxID=2849669 RepID=UPI001CDA06A2|nr:branched-chain amino acid ABC transporter substrate-binding protein [Nocardioides nematodiphilus]MCA1982534.1 branched-chain amino acid ABC transporter substrate-binding protein [Nocardioides nematodiphilus]
MMGTKKTARMLAVAGIAALALSACGSSGNNASDNTAGGGGGKGGCGNYSLAFMGALTGDAGALGVNMINGVKLAVDEYNQKHADCKVTVKDFDSQGSPDKAPALATQIVQDSSIAGLVGPGFSGESNATGKTFFEAGMPSISPSATDDGLTKQGWTTWHRVIGNNGAQATAAAKYLKETVGAKKVFVVDDAQDYSKGLAEAFKTAAGSMVVGSDQIQVGQTDMSAVVTQVKASGADAFYYGGYYAEAGLLAKQLRNAGFKGTFMSGDGAEDPAFVKAAGSAAAEGALLTAPAGPAPADFNSRVKASTGAAAGLYTTQAYDAANIFLAALDAGKTSHQDINSFIGSYTGDGVSGPIAFDQNGDIKQSTIWVYTVKNGQLDQENPTAIK